MQEFVSGAPYTSSELVHFRNRIGEKSSDIDTGCLQTVSDSRYQKRKKHKLFCKRAGIEPTIGHLKSDHRLSRNFYKGVTGDAVNLLLPVAAYNFQRAMRALLFLFKIIREMLSERSLMNQFPLRISF